MSSGGGLMTLETGTRFPIRLVESGPAGGAVLAGRIAAECAHEQVVAFDMGGTTAKICLIDGFTPETVRGFEVDRAARFLKGSGLPLRIPVIEMIEIGAGGGSVARVDELGQIAVGPRSAGADPGPACYGRGGEDATVTDADLVLGRIDANRFAGGTMALQPEAANLALAHAVADPLDLTTQIAACGISEVVDERMANAARVHAIERGRSIGDHTLIAFGGAAPLHAARLAEKLGIDRIVVPTHAGVGSAIGFLRAPVAYEVVQSRYMRLKRFDCASANRVLAALSEDARGVVSVGAPGAAVAGAVQRPHALRRSGARDRRTAARARVDGGGYGNASIGFRRRVPQGVLPDHSPRRHRDPELAGYGEYRAGATRPRCPGRTSSSGWSDLDHGDP